MISTFWHWLSREAHVGRPPVLDNPATAILKSFLCVVMRIYTLIWAVGWTKPHRHYILNWILSTLYYKVFPFYWYRDTFEVLSIFEWILQFSPPRVCMHSAMKKRTLAEFCAGVLCLAGSKCLLYSCLNYILMGKTPDSTAQLTWK